MAADQHRDTLSQLPSSADGPQDNNEMSRRSGHSDTPSKDNDQDVAVTKQGVPMQTMASIPSKAPASVAPIPSIGRISPVPRGIQIASAEDRPELPQAVGARLVGKPIDEDGDIVDDKTGQVLAHAAGDLPSMVGRRVSNSQGDILGSDGELLGYVADIVGWPRARPTPPPRAPAPRQPPRSLFDLVGRARSSLMVDAEGNILDEDGNIVGTFHDNNNPLHSQGRNAKEALRQRRSREKEKHEQAGSAGQEDGEDDGATRQDEESKEEACPSSSHPTPPQAQPRPARTEDERRRNAEEWRKENLNESPSDIFLDIKSTREGIQLTIRIPTVFNGQQATPKISFS
ncbi:hypothetical protein VTJ83DRAFT_5108 [Remersonia thermophila]|uniref:Uncharacterized protein n=1 Tax=Remersonia thermophila TaxID=72144 RepID=A0ABR4DDD4_9PEZI